MNDILALSGTAQARLIRRGVLSSAELVEAHLARIHAVNSSLNAVVEVLEPSTQKRKHARTELIQAGPVFGKAATP
jgi:Asp-tRNA(Asn)/Glu-tRNA(Gln) amidotransferase A subunit family amidase